MSVPLQLVCVFLALILLVGCAPANGQSTGSITVHPSNPKLNDLVTLTCPPGYTTWNSELGSLPKGSTKGNTLTLSKVWYTDMGWYTCENAAQETLTVDLSLSFLTISPPKPRIGDKVTLTCPPGFNNWTSDHHNWNLPAGSVLNANTLTLVNVQDDFQGLYTCQDDDGYSDSSYLTLLIMKESPKGPSPNDTVTLTCPRGYSFWSSSNGALPRGSTKNGWVLTLYNVWKAKGATFTCKDIHGDSFSTYIGWPLVDVHAKPQIPTLNDRVTLTCPFGYNNWTFEHGTLPSGSIRNGSVLTLAKIQFEHFGQYNCTNATGHSRSVYLRMACPCCGYWSCYKRKLGAIPSFFAGKWSYYPGSLDLHGNQLKRIPANIFSPIATRLESIDFSKNGLRYLYPESFNNLTGLVQLWLFQNQLQSLPAGVFDSLRSLQRMFLQYNQLTTLPSNVFDKLTKLSTLRLEYNRLTTIPDNVFGKLTSLKILNLNDNQLKKPPFHSSHRPASLSFLHVDRNHFSCVGDVCSWPWDVMKKWWAHWPQGWCTNPVAYDRRIENVKSKCLASYCHHSAIANSNKIAAFFIAPGSNTSVQCLSGYGFNRSTPNYTTTALSCDKTGKLTSSPTCIDLDDCASSPCPSPHVCQDGINNYTCICRAGYTGTECETDINECASSPCQIGAHCQDGVNQYTCACPAGYTGTQCQTEINECASSPCPSTHLCQDGIDKYTCTCPAGYTGPRCQTDINECASSPCSSTHVCQDGINNYTCVCRAGFAGTNCQTDINECASSPCQNGAPCRNEINKFTCTCPAGYTGTHCQTDINECASSPCLYGGFCQDGINKYTCVCAEGRTGPQCQSGIDECASSPCQNGAHCQEGLANYTCTCSAGYTGIQCQTNINDCASSPCPNGSYCQDGIDKFTCAPCPAGYTGFECGTDINECASSPCLNGGSCQDGINNYTCTCPAGFTGTHCQTDIKECTSSPCLNGGSCKDGINNYTCTCPAGYTGTQCQTDVKECASSPCLNGGSCQDGINKYTCTCPAGYSGTHCQTDVKECSSSPCLNGGSCQDGINNYTCTCPAGFTGTQCQKVSTGSINGESQNSKSGSSSQVGAIAGSVAGLICLCAFALLAVQTRRRYMSRFDKHARKDKKIRSLSQLSLRHSFSVSSLSLNSQLSRASPDSLYVNAEEAKGQTTGTTLKAIDEDFHAAKGFREPSDSGPSTFGKTPTLMNGALFETAYANGGEWQDTQTRLNSLSKGRAWSSVIADVNKRSAEVKLDSSAWEEVYEILPDQPRRRAVVYEEDYSSCELIQSHDAPAAANQDYSNCDLLQSQDTQANQEYSNCDLLHPQDTQDYSNCDLLHPQDTQDYSNCDLFQYHNTPANQEYSDSDLLQSQEAQANQDYSTVEELLQALDALSCSNYSKCELYECPIQQGNTGTEPSEDHQLL